MLSPNHNPPPDFSRGTWFRWDGQRFGRAPEGWPFRRSPELDQLAGVRLIDCSEPGPGADLGNVERFRDRFKRVSGEPISGLSVLPGPSARTIRQFDTDPERGRELGELAGGETDREAGLAEMEGQDAFGIAAGNADDSSGHPVHVEAEITAPDVPDGPQHGDGRVGGGDGAQEEAVGVTLGIGDKHGDSLAPEPSDGRDLVGGQLRDHPGGDSTEEGEPEC